MNPKAYCAERGMKSSEFVQRVREVAPKYTKVTHCMASDPAYGVTLRPAVIAHIRGKQEVRKLPYRLSFRCSAWLVARLTAAKETLDYETNQDVLLFAVRWFLDEMDKRVDGERKT